MILDDIIAKKRERLKHKMQQMSIEGWRMKLKGGGLHRPLDFFETLKKSKDLAVIAEIKKASPSAGIICEEFNCADIAREYLKSGVQAISVLTEQDFFLGDDSYLVKVRQTVPLPVLRKDFLIDIWQVYESRYLGADAVLLIVSVLSDDLLKMMLTVSGILGMQCLVEIHSEEELERALNAGARIIGINNRDLRTFETDLKTTERLIRGIPNDRAVVSESGIKTAKDIEYLRSIGADAVLIGETLMRSGAVQKKIEELLHGSAASDAAVL